MKNTNLTERYEFTIIIPIYNVEDNLSRLEQTISDYLSHSKLHTCVLFVNDGSKDNSGKGIIDICSRNNDFFYIQFKKNAGLSAAIKAGIDVTQSKYVGYMDADMQTTPEDFDKLLEYASEYPLVTGIRAQRKDTAFKRMQSKIANGFRRMMTGDRATDTGCPLKVMQTVFAKRIPFFTGMHRFLPALIMLQTDGRFKEIAVRHFPRTAGASKYHLWNRLVGPFKDCFAYRWMKKRYINYDITLDNLSEEL